MFEVNLLIGKAGNSAGSNRGERENLVEVHILNFQILMDCFG